MKHVESRKGTDGTINLDYKELASIFVSRPSHTKNYEEKLFLYDPFSVVTTAGSAAINGKRIEELVEELIIQNNTDPDHVNKELETRVVDFCDFFAAKVTEHVNSNGRFNGTSFIYTNYNKDTHRTCIYKIYLHGAFKKDIDDPNFKPYDYHIQPDIFKVVCDGQNRISERILFGDIDTTTTLIPKIVNQIIKDHGLSVNPETYSEVVFEALQKSGQLATLNDDMKMFQISSLSLQQAVDLACLLMRLEMDFQQYTQNIPTVGGLIKLATIDKDGIKLISGNGIMKPEYIR